jgi:probable phosphoglycerate mutase
LPLDLYLVRHGGTAWTETGQHTSHTDLPLLPQGEAEARRVGERLLGLNFRAAYTSDLQRSLRTAELAGFSEPVVTRQLREFDYGDYEGLTTPEIQLQRPGWQIYADGCPGGETPAQVYQRATAFLERMGTGDGDAIVFSHGHFLRALGVAWVGLEISAAAGLALDTGALCVLRAGDRGRVIQLWNSTRTR